MPGPTRSLTVVLPQSEAHSGDRDVLLETIPIALPTATTVTCTHRFTGGYSSCKVYLALITHRSAQAPRPQILKIGPREDLRKEREALKIAKGFVHPDNVASQIAYAETGDAALLVLDYANHRGRAPLDLENILKRVENQEAFAAVVEMVANWGGEDTWQDQNLSSLIHGWLKPKLSKLPQKALASEESPIIYSPDFGEAYTNPIHFLTRNLARKDGRVPYGFAHGDLNLRNVLFARGEDGAIYAKHPVAIDFQHAEEHHLSITDFAKLESCLRHQSLRPIDSVSALTQTVSFLHSTRQDLRLSTLPDGCTDKWLQDLWRCIKIIREAVIKRFPQMAQDGSSNVYWATLLSFGITTSTYTQLPEDVRHLAYVDAAAMLTLHIQPRENGKQHIFSVHNAHSPQISLTEDDPVTSALAPLLKRAILAGQAVLVVGANYGRANGVEPLLPFLQRLHRQLTDQDPPMLSSVLLLEAIQRKTRRQDVLRAIRQNTERWEAPQTDSFHHLPWTTVIHCHLHSVVYNELCKTSSEQPLRVDSLEEATRHADNITAGRTSYIPYYGDATGVPDGLRMTAADRRERDQVLGLTARSLERRQKAIAIAFWKCEDISVEQIADIRSALSTELAVSVDSYFLTDQHDGLRDAALNALDVRRISISLDRLTPALQTEESPALTAPTFARWSRGEQTYTVPDLAGLSGGLLQLLHDDFSPTLQTSREFLLGAPPTIFDVEEQRVVRRRILDDQILPAVRSALGEREREAHAVVIRGRAGSGVSTLLCHAAALLHKEGKHPVVVADTRLSRGNQEWVSAGELLAELAYATTGCVLVFAEATDQLLDHFLEMSRTCVEKGGRLVLILGGRNDALLAQSRQGRKLQCREVKIGDTLSQAEWSALARILKSQGFAQGTPTEVLTERMQAVGRLLPALYEATDGQNRKFKEIVTHEYYLYARDTLVQMAYRLICALGAFDISISQYWMLKALGNRGISDAVRILAALSDDIVVSRDTLSEHGDIVISPTHRLIAEEVMNVATPRIAERLQDLERLIATANMASQQQGMAIATLLYKNGPLMQFVRRNSDSNSLEEERVRRLFRTALENGPLHPQVEVHIRQHWALLLRRWDHLDEALQQALLAREKDNDNSATLHILGILHETRAEKSWRNFAQNGDEKAISRARHDEQDALEFFREVRNLRPLEEHGYESEARYYRKKAQLLTFDGAPEDLADEARHQLFQGLALLRDAASRVPSDRLQESARTKSQLLKLAGRIDDALATLRSALVQCDDPVRRLRLLRSIAILSIEAGIWDDARESLKCAIQIGDRDATLYLMLDDCLFNLKSEIKERVATFRDSAEEYNRWDVETLVRWAILSTEEGLRDRASEALRRADEVACENLSIFERERTRYIAKADGRDMRIQGTISRLIRAGEGFIREQKSKREYFFRAGREAGNEFTLGTEVTFCLAVRVRGFRAINIHRVVG